MYAGLTQWPYIPAGASSWGTANSLWSSATFGLCQGSCMLRLEGKVLVSFPEAGSVRSRCSSPFDQLYLAPVLSRSALGPLLALHLLKEMIISQRYFFPARLRQTRRVAIHQSRNWGEPAVIEGTLAERVWWTCQHRAQLVVPQEDQSGAKCEQNHRAERRRTGSARVCPPAPDTEGGQSARLGHCPDNSGANSIAHLVQITGVAGGSVGSPLSGDSSMVTSQNLACVMGGCRPEPRPRNGTFASSFVSSYRYNANTQSAY